MCSKRFCRAMLVGAALVTSAGLHAQQFPTKLIRLVSPYPAGALNDWLAREIAEGLSKRLGQPVIVENRGGAAATIGTDIVAKAPPDGYTLLMGSMEPLGIVPAVKPDIPYAIQKDFSFIARVSAAIPWVIMVSSNLPVKTLPELVAYAKAKPGAVRYGSSGLGSSGHLAFATLEVLTKTQVTHVPYKGVAPMVNDLLGGHLDAGIVGVGTILPYVNNERVRVLAVTGSKRSALLPNVPSAGELGLPGVDAEIWFGIVGPAGIPAPIVNRLSQEIIGIVEEPAVHKRLVDKGIDPLPQGPADFRNFAINYYQANKRVVDAAKITMD